MKLSVPQTICISLTVLTEDQEKATRVSEVLGRTMTGLALDGISCNMNMSEIEIDPDD